MSSTGKQYQLLQNYNFDEPTTSTSEDQNFQDFFEPILQYDGPLPVSSTPKAITQQTNQQTIEKPSTSSYIPTDATFERVYMVEKPKSRKSLGYSVYAENFNKLLKRGPSANRRKSSVKTDGEEDVVYYGTDTSEQTETAFNGNFQAPIVSNQLMLAQPQITPAHSQNSANETPPALTYRKIKPPSTSGRKHLPVVQENVKADPNVQDSGRFKSKPAISYATLVALALKNSQTGCLTVQEVYDFVDSNFPFFRTANSGWKNSVRHNLSFSKFFMKIEARRNEGDSRRSYIWTVNPSRSHELEASLAKLMERDKENTLKSLANPADFDAIRTGTLNFQFKRTGRRKPMAQVRGRENALSRNTRSSTEGAGVGSNRSSPFTFNNTVQGSHSGRGPRRVLSFGATPTGGVSESVVGFAGGLEEDSDYNEQLPELTKLLSGPEYEQMYFSPQVQDSSLNLAVTGYQSSSEIYGGFEDPPANFMQPEATTTTASERIGEASFVDSENAVSTEKVTQNSFCDTTQLKLLEVNSVPNDAEMTPPHKIFSDIWEDFSSIMSPGNNVMLSDAIVNRSPEQELKFLSVEQWHYEPMTPSRWTDVAAPSRPPQCKIARTQLL